jgi:phospholipid/cholesterol/gamma-HCH transport system substrate-binding protein
MIRSLRLIVTGLLVMGVVAGGIYYSVRYAYGAFDDYYYVNTTLPRSGQQLLVGSDVRIKGVIIGKVTAVELVDRQARLEMQIEKNYQVPKDVEAVIELKTPLGAKYVDLEFDAAAGGPYLEDGDEISDARVGPELEDLLEDGTHLLDAIEPEDAGTLITTLADASQGHGVDVARGLDANSELTELFANTLGPQIQALHDFRVLFDALEDKGVDFNRLADALNEGVPVYASESAQKDLRSALEALVPFSDNLSDLLVLNRDDWDRMMDYGDEVLSTIEARPAGLRDLLQGLHTYVYKLGQPIGDHFMLSDGSAGAGFVNFIGGNSQKEEENQICTAFPPEVRDQIPACKGTAR